MELDEKNLYNAYIIENKSRIECAKLFNCSEALIKKRLSLYGIKKDTVNVQKVRENTMMNRYGVSNPMLDEQMRKENILSKQQRTDKQDRETTEKRRQTLLERYNVTNAAQLDTNFFKNMTSEKRVELKRKSARTFVENYTDDIRLKKEQTNLARYGTKYYSQSDKFKEWTIKKNPNYVVINDREALIKVINSLEEPTIYNLCNVLGYSYSTVYKAIEEFGLSEMVKKNYSTVNIYWHNLIEEKLGICLKYEGNIFNNPYEKVDLYDETRHVAIDINPTVTHNTQFNPFHPEHKSHITTTYHFDRAKEAEENGWLLYQIFDWDDEVGIIRQLKSVFGLNERIYARKCELKKVSKKEANGFFDKWHLQKRAESIVNYALFYQGVMVACMSFGRARFNKNAQYELIRYASRDLTVVGGASRLFQAFIKDYKPQSILTYSDYAKGQGNVYRKLGFTFFGYAGLTALYAPLNRKGVAYKTQKASREYHKYGKDFNSCKAYFNAQNWYRINDAGNKIWLWKNPRNNSEN